MTDQLTADRYDAVLFDLDGVITDTAAVHARAWKTIELADGTPDDPPDDARAERAVVVEDAISGGQAGRDGGFGLVVGVDRHGDADALRDNGADVVVTDLAELLA